MSTELKRLLQELKENHKMYIGSKSLDKLLDFIDGYIRCMYERDKIIPEFLVGFQDFIEKEYGLQNNKNVFRHWSEIISFFNQTEEDTFDEFYIKMEKFSKLSEEEKNIIAEEVRTAKLKDI